MNIKTFFLGLLLSQPARAFDFLSKEERIGNKYRQCYELVTKDKPYEQCFNEYQRLANTYGIDSTDDIKHLQKKVLEQKREECKLKDNSCLEELVVLSEKFPLVDSKTQIRRLQDYLLGINFDTCLYQIRERTFTSDKTKKCIDDFERLSKAYSARNQGEINYLRELRMSYSK